MRVEQAVYVRRSLADVVDPRWSWWRRAGLSPPVHNLANPTVIATNAAPAVTPRMTSLASTATTTPIAQPDARQRAYHDAARSLIHRLHRRSSALGHGGCVLRVA